MGSKYLSVQLAVTLYQSENVTDKGARWVRVDSSLLELFCETKFGKESRACCGHIIIQVFNLNLNKPFSREVSCYECHVVLKRPLFCIIKQNFTLNRFITWKYFSKEDCNTQLWNNNNLSARHTKMYHSKYKTQTEYS